MIEVLSVDVIDEARIRNADARRAGYPNAEAVRADLRGPADLATFRIRLRRLDGPDPRDVLAATDALSPSDIDDIDHRLGRLDRASPRGPWTAATLAAISVRPAVAALRPTLLASLGLTGPDGA